MQWRAVLMAAAWIFAMSYTVTHAFVGIYGIGG
jgi:hypothetical protein